MRVVAVADLHGRLPELPAADLILIAGDIAPDLGFHQDLQVRVQRQTDWLESAFCPWVAGLHAGRVLAVPGNHDWFGVLPAGCKAELYIDNLVEHEGRRLYFTPWIPYAYGMWNYELQDTGRRLAFGQIPMDIDVLVSHGPAYGILDGAANGDHAGCLHLRANLFRTQPKYFIFGHIHEGLMDGRFERAGDTACLHASMWGRDWRPIEFDL